jgi:hypothetical protein
MLCSAKVSCQRTGILKGMDGRERGYSKSTWVARMGIEAKSEQDMGSFRRHTEPDFFEPSERFELSTAMQSLVSPNTTGGTMRLSRQFILVEQCSN